jgi:hypothetical protein
MPCHLSQKNQPFEGWVKNRGLKWYPSSRKACTGLRAAEWAAPLEPHQRVNGHTLSSIMRSEANTLIYK